MTYNKLRESIIDAAEEWFDEKKPFECPESEHLLHPALNCTSAIEVKLAKAVAEWRKGP